MNNVIDWTRIGELRDDVGEDDFEEVIELFLGEVEEVLGRLGTAGDSAASARDLHFLKGSTLNVGFEALARLCAEGEAAAASGRMGEIDIPAIRQSYAASKSAFEAGVDARFDGGAG